MVTIQEVQPIQALTLIRTQFGVHGNRQLRIGDITGIYELIEEFSLLCFLLSAMLHMYCENNLYYSYISSFL